MKTTILTIAMMFCFLINKSQNEYESKETLLYAKSETSLVTKKLNPVYFNFSRRQLRDAQKNAISPIEFLNTCRSINDSVVQFQVARYDAFTRDKQKLGLIALGSGFSAFALLGTAVSTAEQNNNTNASASFAFFGTVALIAIPVIAIYSTVPHQKRKSVLFRDLPIAYNQYVEKLND
jgi:hypothetical protein